MAGPDKQGPFHPVPRAQLHFDSLRWTVTIMLETHDATLVDDLFGVVDRRDLVFGDSVAVRCVAVRQATPDPTLQVAELTVGAIASIPAMAAAALIAEWLTTHARKRAERVVIDGRVVALSVGSLRQALARSLGQARGG